MERTDKEIIKELAQMVADLSAMMMPLSGLTMIALMQAANKAGEHIGEDIKPSESAFEGTVKMVNIIRKPMEDEIKKLGESLYKVGIESILLHKQHKFDQCAKDIRDILQKHHLLKDSDYCQKIEIPELSEEEKMVELIEDFNEKYNCKVYVEKDGNQYHASTFDPSTLAPPEWPETEYAYGINPSHALKLLAKLKKWSV